MRNKKADTTIDQFINILKETESDPQKVINLIKAIEGIIPVKKGRKMPKIDENLNKNFRIKRIGYSVVAKIKRFDNNTNLYDAEILAIDSGESHFVKGDRLVISKRELELTGKKA